MNVSDRRPVGETVAKIDDEVAVGENLDFQRRWWVFERIAWLTFAAIVLLDLVGAFGRGYLATAHRTSEDGAVEITYERVERAGAASTARLRLGPAAIHDGKLQVFVGESMVSDLGAERVIPQPELTTIGDGGLTYTFSAASPPATIAFAFKPPAAGIFHFHVHVTGTAPIDVPIYVAP